MRKIHKWAGIIAVCVFLSIFISIKTFSENESTQGQFIVKLLDSLGLTYKLAENATIDDYAKLAQDEGLKLPEGFSPDKIITKEEKADLLSQALKLEATMKKEHREQSDIYRNKATIERMTGAVMVKRKGETEWIPAEINMKLAEGDFIKTPAGAIAFLRVGVAGKINVGENSELELKTLSTQANKKSENIAIYLSVGELLVDVRGIPEGSKFETHTPTTLAAVRGTIYTIKVEPEKGETIIKEKEKTK